MEKNIDMMTRLKQKHWTDWVLALIIPTLVALIAIKAERAFSQRDEAVKSSYQKVDVTTYKEDQTRIQSTLQLKANKLEVEKRINEVKSDLNIQLIEIKARQTKTNEKLDNVIILLVERNNTP